MMKRTALLSALIALAVSGTVMAAPVENNSTNDQAIAVGAGAQAQDVGVALGRLANAAESSVAIGVSSTAGGNLSTALGYGSEAEGDYAVAIGRDTTAKGTNSVVVGSNSTAEKTAIAIGSGLNASGERGIAIGSSNTVTGFNGIAIGFETTSTDTGSVAIGLRSHATNESATAMGYGAEATGNRASAYGANAKATGLRSTALGYSSSATNDFDVAVGSHSQTTAAVDVASATVGGTTYQFAGSDATGAVSFGGGGSSSLGVSDIKRQLQNVAAGQVTAESTDAVNGSQLYAAYQGIDANTNAIAGLGNSVARLDGRLDKVGAGAAALAALHPLDYDAENKLSFAAGVGNYGGETAGAVGAFYRPNEDVMLSIGGTAGNGENMVNMGVSFAIGQGSSGVAKLSKAELVTKVQDMEVKCESVDAENKELKHELNNAKARIAKLEELVMQLVGK